MEEGCGINIITPVGIGNEKTMNIESDHIVLNAPEVLIYGKITDSNGLNIGAKTPIFLLQIEMLL